MAKTDDVTTTGSAAIGAIVGAAAAGTGGAVLGGLVGYIIGKASEEKR